MHSTGFPPVVRVDARTLILGSLPGAMSLARRQYYAQPRNAFWPIMGAMAGAGPELPYAERLERLLAARIALWDVCASGFRRGSLDAAIDAASVTPNDFVAFFAGHRQIALIAFNGSAAADLFARFVLPRLPAPVHGTRRIVLPSTSPAHAAMPLQEKLRRWREALGWTGGVVRSADAPM